MNTLLAEPVSMTERKPVCYALVASDEPNRVRYVGSTVSALKPKLATTLVERTQHGPKGRWIAEVLARGASIQFRILSTHSTAGELPAAERDWIQFYWPTGDLLNRTRSTFRPGIANYESWRNTDIMKQQ